MSNTPSLSPYVNYLVKEKLFWSGLVLIVLSNSWIAVKVIINKKTSIKIPTEDYTFYGAMFAFGICLIILGFHHAYDKRKEDKRNLLAINL